MSEVLRVLPAMTVAAIGLPALAFAFGWSLLRSQRGVDAEERFAAGAALGVAVLGGSQVVALSLHWHPASIGWGVTGAMALATLLLLRRQPAPGVRWRDARTLAGVWTLGYFHLLAIQTMLPLYVGGDWFADWQMHYHFAQVFAGVKADDYAYLGQYTLASRTPLFNATAGLALSLTGDHFWSYQLAASWLNWLVPLPLYLLLRDRYGSRAARLAMLLAPLNVWLLHMAWFVWTKLLAAYFLLLGLHFYLRFLRCRDADPTLAWRMLVAWWLCGLLAFLTHPVSVVYVTALSLHAVAVLWPRRRLWLRPAHVAALVAVAVVLAGGWYGWLFWRFGMVSTTRSSPTAMMARGPLAWIDSLRINGWTSLVPDELGYGLRDEPPLWEQGAPRAVRLYRGITSVYFSTLTGALTLSLSAYLLYRAVSRVWAWLARTGRIAHRGAAAGRGDTVAIWTFSGLSCLGAMLLHPNSSAHGLAHNAYFASTIVWVGLAWGLLARAGRGAAALVLAGMLAEFLLLFWSHAWYANREPLVLDPFGSNWEFKRADGNVFLSAALGPLGPVAWVAAAIAQAGLIALLMRWLFAAGRAVDTMTSDEVPATKRGDGVKG
jgi:hypothetical protein